MTWFKADDGYWRGPKVRRLGRGKASTTVKVAASGLWILAGTWAADQLTDGFVPWEIVEGWDPGHGLAEALIRAKLWEPAEVDGESGVRFHDWADWQPTRVEVERKRAQNRERVRRFRDRQGAEIAAVESDMLSEDDGGDDVGNALPQALVTHAPSRPVPTRPDPSSIGRSERSTSSTERARGAAVDAVVEALRVRTNKVVDRDHGAAVVRLLHSELGERPEVRDWPRYLAAVVKDDPRPDRLLPTPIPPQFERE